MKYTLFKGELFFCDLKNHIPFFSSGVDVPMGFNDLMQSVHAVNN